MIVVSHIIFHAPEYIGQGKLVVETPIFNNATLGSIVFFCRGEMLIPHFIKKLRNTCLFDYTYCLILFEEWTSIYGVLKNYYSILNMKIFPLWYA